MSEDHSSLNEIEQARQRGHFEGQVLSQLTDIKNSVVSLTQNYQAIEMRTHNNELAIGLVQESVKGITSEITRQVTQEIPAKLSASEKIHQDIYTKLDANTNAINSLIQARASFTGGLTVIQLLYSGIVALVIAFVTAHFVK